MKSQFSAISFQLSAKILMCLCLVICILYLASSVEAAIGIRQPDNAGPEVRNTDADTLLGGIIRNAVTLVFTLASVTTVIMFLWGAVDWILSSGDKEKLGKARQKIVASLIGLVLLAVSFLVMSLLGVFIGINPIRDLRIPYLGDGAGEQSTTQRANELRRDERGGN